jgi:hypothetical protein
MKNIYMPPAVDVFCFTSNTLGSGKLKETLHLSLKALQVDSEGVEIYPEKALFATRARFRWEMPCESDCAISIGLRKQP